MNRSTDMIESWWPDNAGWIRFEPPWWRYQLSGFRSQPLFLRIHVLKRSSWWGCLFACLPTPLDDDDASSLRFHFLLTNAIYTQTAQSLSAPARPHTHSHPEICTCFGYFWVFSRDTFVPIQSRSQGESTCVRWYRFREFISWPCWSSSLCVAHTCWKGMCVLPSI